MDGVNGLAVVGASHAADERAAGEALSAALRRAGLDTSVIAAIALGPGAGPTGAVHAHEVVASPVTAARHEGAAIDPGHLADRLRDAAGEQPVVITAAGGLLAPLTARYSVRDLVRELGLPLVLALPAGPDAVNLARLGAESARGAGMTLVAVVLTGWPDPPDRVLLDERRLLDELAPALVLTLPAAPGAREEAIRRWPVEEWLASPADATPSAEAPPTPAPAPAPPTASVVLEPYETWEPRPLGDPRSTPRPQLMTALLEIVAAEGPMRATRAYTLYNRAAGGRKLTMTARTPLSSAAYWLSRENRVVLTSAEDIPWQDDDLLRTPETPAVTVRSIGPRTLEEVPLDEIAELMRRLRSAHRVGDAAGLKRAVLDAYGLVRLTTRADEYLGLAVGLMD